MIYFKPCGDQGNHLVPNKVVPNKGLVPNNQVVPNKGLAFAMINIHTPRLPWSTLLSIIVQSTLGKF